MSQMTYYMYKGAKFLGRPTKRDSLGKPTERRTKADDGSPAREPLAGIGIFVVGQSYDITEWTARYEGELFDLKGAKREAVTKTMDGEEKLSPNKVTEAMIDLGMVKEKPKSGNTVPDSKKLERTKVLEDMKVAELEEVMTKHKIPLDVATNKEGRVAAILAKEFPSK